MTVSISLPTSAQQPRGVILPHRHCNMIPALCGSGSLLVRDCGLVTTPGIVCVRLSFNFIWGNLARIVNNNEVV